MTAPSRSTGREPFPLVKNAHVGSVSSIYDSPPESEMNAMDKSQWQRLQEMLALRQFYRQGGAGVQAGPAAWATRGTDP